MRALHRTVDAMALTESGETWRYESEGRVGVWIIEDIEGLFESEIVEAQRHFERVAGGGDLVAAIIVFDDTTSLGREMQEHMAEAWSELGRSVDLERIAYVAEGVRAMAVKANVEIPDTELKAYNSISDALEWAAA